MVSKLTLGLLIAVLATTGLHATEAKANGNNVKDNAVYEAVKGKLVAVDGKKVTAYDAKKLAGAEYYALYYSASWCPPCRRFTPKLVEAYEAIKKSNPGKIEVILVGYDRSKKALDNYLVKYGMSWPALKFTEVRKNKLAAATAPRGIPSLVILDRSGKVIEKGNYNALKKLQELGKK